MITKLAKARCGLMGFPAPQHSIGEPGLLSEVLRVFKRST
jgi:hypothetical protein